MAKKHPDEAEDRALIRGMVKPTALKRVGTGKKASKRSKKKEAKYG